MIEQFDVENVARIGEFASELEIGRGWYEHPGRMVVEHDDARSTQEQRIAEHELDVHGDVILCARGDDFEPCNLVRGIAYEQDEMLLVIVETREDSFGDLIHLRWARHGDEFDLFGTCIVAL